MNLPLIEHAGEKYTRTNGRGDGGPFDGLSGWPEER